MAQLKIHINVLQNPKTGDRFKYQILKDNTYIRFQDSDGVSTDKVDKTFIKKENFPLVRLGQMNLNGILNPKFRSVSHITFDREIRDMVSIPAREGRPELLALVGDFTRVETPEGVINSRGFIILEITPAQIDNDIKIYYNGSNTFEGSKLQAIDYDPLSDEIAIGGYIQSYTAPTQRDASGVVFFNLRFNQFNTFKTGMFNNLGGIGVEGVVFKLKYIHNSNLIIQGEFETLLSTTSAGFGIISATARLAQPFHTNFSVDYGGATKIFSFDVDTNGDIYLVGSFGEVNGIPRRDIAKITLDGHLYEEFNTSPAPFQPSASVRHVSIGNNGIYLGGNFFRYNGEEDIGRIIRVDKNNAIRDSRFHIGTQALNIRDMRYYFDPTADLTGRLYVAGNVTGNNAKNGFIFNNSGDILFELFVNNRVNVFYRYRNSMFFGGNFTQFNNNSMTLSNHQIAVGDTVQVTLNNILNNLENESVEQDSVYSMGIGDVEHDYYYFGSTADVVNIEDVPEYVEITYKKVSDDQEPSVPSSLLKPLLTRSDNVFKSRTGDYDETVFTIRTYKSSIDNVDGGDSIIFRKDLLPIQDNTWINLSRTINTFNMEVEEVVKYIKTSQTPGTLFPTKQGKFGFVSAINYLGDNNVGNTAERYFILKGFRDTIEPPLTIPPVLLNGDYREFMRGENWLIPINMSKVHRIRVGATSIILSSLPGYNSDTNKQDGLFNYLNLDINSYLNRGSLTVEFINNDLGVLKSFKVLQKGSNCVVSPLTVYFRNRWGKIERTILSGFTKKSYKVKSKDYNTSLVDINGNLIRGKHSKKVFNRSGEREFVCNTGSVSSKLNPMYVDLVHSEEVWIDNGDIVPVVLKDHTFREDYDFLKGVVNYEFTFEESANYIKNIV